MAGGCFHPGPGPHEQVGAIDRTLTLVLLDVLEIAVIVVAARLFGKVAQRLGQPALIGEVVAGIALGPSLLGLLPGRPDVRLFPSELTSYLRMLAELGPLLSAFMTARIAIHEIFGAFLFGASMPRQGARHFRRAILDRLGTTNSLVLLPVFFVIAGFNVELRNFTRVDLTSQLLLVLTAAGVGKLGGTFAGARLQRMTVRHSAAIAVLINTCGLTELVVLTVGNEVGIFDTDMFTIMVVVALATTMFCQPALGIIYPDRVIQEDIDAAAAAEPERLPDGPLPQSRGSVHLRARSYSDDSPSAFESSGLSESLGSSDSSESAASPEVAFCSSVSS